MATTKDLAQLLIEETPRPEGAVTTAPYRLSTNVLYLPAQEVGLQPGAQFDTRADEIRGLEGEPPGLVDAFEVEGALNTRAYGNIMPYLLSIAGWQGVVTAGDGIIVDPDAATIPATAYRWVFNKRLGNTAKTAQLTIAYADELQWIRGQGVGISTWTLNAAGMFTSSLMGMVYARLGSDPNLTPTYDSLAIPHFRRGDLTLTWLGGGASPTDFSVTMPNPLLRFSSMGLATPSFFPDLMEHGDERIVPTGSIPKRALSSTDLDALLAGTTFLAKARWKSTKSILATSYKYSMWLEMPSCQYTGGDMPTLRNVRRFAPEFAWKAAIDEAAGYDARITIVNSVAAIETYA
jgi:hypothetical protein